MAETQVNLTTAQVRKAFDLIGHANGVTLLSLDEMESIVLRAVSGEFNSDIKLTPDSPAPLPPRWAVNNPLADAIDFAARAHYNQLDKAGDPYLWHVLRVGISLLPDLTAAIVGVLHDVVEDAPAEQRCTMAKEVEWRFGIDVGHAVRDLTRSPGGSYEDYIQRVVAAGPLARKVKVADLRDNLNPERLRRGAARGADVERLYAKYTAAMKVFLLAERPTS